MKKSTPATYHSPAGKCRYHPRCWFPKLTGLHLDQVLKKCHWSYVHLGGTCFTLFEHVQHVVKSSFNYITLIIEHWWLDHRICSATPLRSCALFRAGPWAQWLTLSSNLRSPCQVDVKICETVVVSQCGTIADLKRVAQRSFGQGFLRLAAPDAF